MKAAKAKKGNEGFAYHIDRQTIYKVSEDVVRRYSRTLNDFRDKKLPFEFKQDAIHELSMKTRLTNLTLVKKGGKWTASDPVQGKEVDQATVKSLLAKLGEMEAKFYLGTKSSRGMKPPVNSVVLKNHKGDEVLALSWGTSFKAKQEVKTDSEEQLYYVKTNKVADTLGVPTSVIDALPGQTLLKSVTAKPLEPKGSSQPAPQSAPASTPAKGS